MNPFQIRKRKKPLQTQQGNSKGKAVAIFWDKTDYQEQENPHARNPQDSPEDIVNMTVEVHADEKAYAGKYES